MSAELNLHPNPTQEDQGAAKMLKPDLRKRRALKTRPTAALWTEWLFTDALETRVLPLLSDCVSDLERPAVGVIATSLSPHRPSTRRPKKPLFQDTSSSTEFFFFFADAPSGFPGSFHFQHCSHPNDFFSQCWGLSPGPLACQASAPLLEPSP